MLTIDLAGVNAIVVHCLHSTLIICLFVLTVLILLYSYCSHPSVLSLKVTRMVVLET